MNDLAQHTAQRFLQIIPAVMRRVHTELHCARHERTPTFGQFRCLAILKDGPKTLSELADRYDVSLPAMSRMVSALVARDWVSRAENPTDRRLITLTLLPAGEVAFAAMVEDAQRQMSRWLESLPDDDLHHLHAGLEALARLLEKEGRK